jgi:hypothetical protein
MNPAMGVLVVEPLQSSASCEIVKGMMMQQGQPHILKLDSWADSKVRPVHTTSHPSLNRLQIALEMVYELAS